MLVQDEYGGKPQPVDREVGIEIEMEGRNLAFGSRTWNVKGDGSLRGTGAEYVLISPIPSKNVYKILENLEKTLAKNGATLTPSNRCGVHIHVNCQHMWFTEVLNFVITYLILEDLLLEYCGEDRVGNLFCLRSSDAEELITALVNASGVGTFRHMMRDDYRYAGVNLVSLHKFGSVEFRSLGTPAKLTDITRWVEMLLSIRDFAISFKHPSALIESVSEGGAAEFARDVLGDNIKYINTSNMEDRVLAGIRRVQDIAYLCINEKRIRVKNSEQQDNPLWTHQYPDTPPPAIRSFDPTFIIVFGDNP